MKLPNLLSKDDLKVVEKRKIWFIIPSGILALAVVFGIFWGVFSGSPLNLSMDFAGGYTVTLKLGTKLTDQTADEYNKLIKDIAKDLRPEEGGDPYGLSISSLVKQNTGEKASISIRYMALKNADMEKVNDRFADELGKLFAYMPLANMPHNGAQYTATFANPVTEAELFNIREAAAASPDLGIAADAINPGVDNRTLIVTSAKLDETKEAALRKLLTVPTVYSGKAETGVRVAALVSTEYLVYAICAILAAFACMLAYIAVRFEISMGISTIIGLAHDLLIMFAFMVIFHIEIGVTFIAALITLLGYSINNTVIIFDRIRDKSRPFAGRKFDTAKIANEAVRDTFVRSMNTAITTLIPLLMITILGVTSIRVFALPIIAGLIAGTYSSLTILPSTWSTLKSRWFNRKPKAKKVKAEAGIKTLSAKS